VTLMIKSMSPMQAANTATHKFRHVRPDEHSYAYHLVARKSMRACREDAKKFIGWAVITVKAGRRLCRP
jgi:hypothetical protein